MKSLFREPMGGTAGVDQADTVDHLLHTQGSDEGLDLQVADHEAVAQTHDGADGNDQNKTVSFSYQDVITRDVRMMLLEN